MQKLFELLIYPYIFSLIEHITVPEQHGRSLVSNLFNPLEYVQLNTDINSTDFSKALDNRNCIRFQHNYICGLLLFIIFINEIKKCFQETGFLIYGDNLKIFHKIQALSDCSKLQKPWTILIFSVNRTSGFELLQMKLHFIHSQL